MHPVKPEEDEAMPLFEWHPDPQGEPQEVSNDPQYSPRADKKQKTKPCSCCSEMIRSSHTYCGGCGHTREAISKAIKAYDCMPALLRRVMKGVDKRHVVTALTRMFNKRIRVPGDTLNVRVDLFMQDVLAHDGHVTDDGPVADDGHVADDGQVRVDTGVQVDDPDCVCPMPVLEGDPRGKRARFDPSQAECSRRNVDAFAVLDAAIAEERMYLGRWDAFHEAKAAKAKTERYIAVLTEFSGTLPFPSILDPSFAEQRAQLVKDVAALEAASCALDGDVLKETNDAFNEVLAQLRQRREAISEMRR